MARTHYKHFLTIPTRWMDNDIYGHVNNVVCYSWFDTVINEYLIRVGGLDIHNASIVGFAVDSGCIYKKSFSFPEPVHAGLCVTKLGNSSVRYEVGLLAKEMKSHARQGSSCTCLWIVRRGRVWRFPMKLGTHFR